MTRFLVLPLVLAFSFGTAFAQEVLTLSNGFADDQFYAYISTDNTVLGDLFAQGGGGSPSGQVALIPGQTYYLQIEAINIGGAGGFASSSTLSDPSFAFGNGTQSLDTSAAGVGYWSAAYGGTTDGSTAQQAWVIPTESALEETNVPFSNVIWANDANSSPGGSDWNGQCTNCYVTFSATIESATPEPSTAMLIFPAALGLYGLRRFRMRRQ